MSYKVLWENDQFHVTTPDNPHLPYSEGPQVVVAPLSNVTAAWEDIDLAKEAFGLASKVSKIMLDLGMAPWFNIQSNGNWGLLPGAKPFFHIHIYGRNKTESWGKPLVLPESPGTYKNDPMPESDQQKLSTALKTEFSKFRRPKHRNNN